MSGIEGKVVAITGASSGIGEATALHLAGRGAKLVLGARRGDRLEVLAKRIVAMGGEAVWACTDVKRRENLVNLVALGCERYRKLDVLINNAGVAPISLLDDLRVEDWEQMIDVNVKGRPLRHCGSASRLPPTRLWTLRQHALHRRHQDCSDNGGLCRLEECRARDL